MFVNIALRSGQLPARRQLIKVIARRLIAPKCGNPTAGIINQLIGQYADVLATKLCNGSLNICMKNAFYGLVAGLLASKFFAVGLRENNKPCEDRRLSQGLEDEKYCSVTCRSKHPVF